MPMLGAEIMETLNAKPKAVFRSVSWMTEVVDQLSSDSRNLIAYHYRRFPWLS